MLCGTGLPPCGKILGIETEDVFHTRLAINACLKYGGVYFPPELSIEINDGKLFISYEHGRYGNWRYTFRHNGSNFDLIGFDISNNYGPIINSETSINFLTKRKLIRENINPNTEESGDEIFKETWVDIEVIKFIQLSSISDFDTFEF